MKFLIENINLNGLNIVKNQTIITDQTTGFDNIFNELLNLLIGNKDISTNVANDNNFFVLPFGVFQSFLLQGINNLQENSQSVEISPPLKTVFSLIKESQIDIGELSNLLQQNLKLHNKNEIQSVLEGFNEKSVLNTENSQTVELINTLSFQETMDKQIPELFKLNSQFDSTDKSDQRKSLSLKSVNESYLEHNEIKPKFFNTEISEKTLNNEKLSSQLLNTNNVQLKTVDSSAVQQKIELPFIQLKEISNIVFKALSSSQKTLVVQLEPPELGKILIKLSMDNVGVRADIKVDYHHVKEALTGLIPEIKSNLNSSGVKVSDFLIDLTKEHKGYSDSYSGQGQRRYRGNEKFIEYFV